MSGNNCVLDTSIIIHAFKNSDIAEKLQSYSEIFVPSVAVGELYYGAYRSANVEKHLAQLHKFMSNCTVLPIDVNTADVYGNIKAALKGKGKPIPENDIWIAAIAIQFDLPLFATDKHFAEIDNIILV